MKENGISRSIISISSPGTVLTTNDPIHAVQTTTYCNDYAANLKKEHPDKFGFWASLPLPHVDLALAEIERAARLGADGYALLTNVQGHYLGDEIFDRVFDELNKRHATVFIHPTTPCMLCSTPAPSGSKETYLKVPPLGRKYPSPMFEFFFDTARMLTNLFHSGTVARTPNIRFVIPHLGGAMPPLLSRTAGFSAIVPESLALSQDQVKETLNRQFYFDLAGFAFPMQFVGLVDGVGIQRDRLVYGSDYPFTPAPLVKKLARELEVGLSEAFGSDRDEAYKILAENAEELLQAQRKQRANM